MKLVAVSKFLQGNANFKDKAQNVSLNEIHDMYMQYLHALLPFSIDLQKEKENFSEIAKEEITNATTRADTTLLVFEEHNHYVGFAIVGLYPNAKSYADVYIQEFFVKEQRKGYGKEAVKQIVERYSFFDVSMYVLEKNTPALAFWKKVMSDNYRDLVEEGKMKPPPEECFEEEKEEAFCFKYWRRKDRF